MITFFSLPPTCTHTHTHTHTELEPLQAPPSTPEPNEEEITLVLPQQTHTSCDRKQLQARQERRRDGIWQQPSIETFSTSSNISPAVVGSTAAGGEDETRCMEGCKLQYNAPGALVRNITPIVASFPGSSRATECWAGPGNEVTPKVQLLI